MNPYKVTHNILGTGIITDFKGEYVIVEFGQEKSNLT